MKPTLSFCTIVPFRYHVAGIEKLKVAEKVLDVELPDTPGEPIVFPFPHTAHIS